MRRYCGRAGITSSRSRSDCRSPRHSQKNAATCAPKPWPALSSGSKTQGSDQCNMSRTNTSRRRILIQGAVRFPNPDETLPHDERVSQSSPALAMRGASWRKGSRQLVSSASSGSREIACGGCIGFHPAAVCTVWLDHSCGRIQDHLPADTPLVGWQSEGQRFMHDVRSRAQKECRTARFCEQRGH